MADIDALRRRSGIPDPLVRELVRREVVATLRERWRVPLTMVIAGAGLGKSTALAQAARMHLAAPEGIEAFVTCEPGDEDAVHLARAISAAFGADGRPQRPIDLVLDAFRSASPLPSCLILDDCHELGEKSSSAALVAELVTRLPTGAHLVLAGRTRPPVPTARLEAEGKVRTIDAEHLAFDPSELSVLAQRAGRPVESVAHLGGWPAVVSLTLVAPLGAHRRYLWDEVLSMLDSRTRRAMLALGMLGSGDGASLARLCDGPIDLDALVATVPLVEPDGAGRVRAHQLWGDVVDRLWPEQEVADMRRATIDLLLERGDVLRAGALAAASQRPTLLGDPALALVHATLGAFPADTGARWLADVATTIDDRPRLVLLDAARRQALNARDPDLRPLLTGLVDHTVDDPATTTVALGLATVAAHASGDQDWLLDLGIRAIAVPGATEPEGEPMLRRLVAGIEATLAKLAGDVARGIAALETLTNGPHPIELGETLARFLGHLLLLAGRAEEASVMADRVLTTSDDAHVRGFADFARWCAGQPISLSDGPGDPVPVGGTNDRFAFVHLVFAGVMTASAGNVAALDAIESELPKFGLGADTRDSAMLAITAAARAVCRHDEETARHRVADHLDAHPLTDPVSNVHLRRFLPYGYVLSETARRAWDDQILGPTHQRARNVARLLLDARECRFPVDCPLPDPAVIFTALPLTWTMELAALAESAGHRDGQRIASWVADRIGAAAHEELRWLSVEGGSDAAAGARKLLGTVSERPTVVTRIEVLGEVRVLVAGEPVASPDLRRARVRELLSVLVVDRSIQRDRLVDLLWRDLDPDAAARNLRVTLTYLRRVLEGDPRTPRGSHLRADGPVVTLVWSEFLEVDLWELDEHLRRIRHKAPERNVASVERSLTAISSLWRGRPLADLVRFDDYGPMVEGLTLRFTDAALEFGELRLAEGAFDESLRAAELAAAASPLSERAARLAVAVHLHRGDPAAAARAAERVCVVLDELGVDPDPATAILLRRATRSAGTMR